MMFWKILLDMCIFLLLHSSLSKNISENRHAWPVTEGPKLWCNTPPLNEGLALINPVFCPTSSTNQKHLKLGQCLEIDDRRSLSKVGDVTWPSLHFTDRSVFYRPAFYRLVSKIVNLWDVAFNLKILGSISNLDIVNCV